MTAPMFHGWNHELNLNATPVVTFTKVFAEGQWWTPNPGDRYALLLFKRQTEKKVSFTRAYRGWRASGAREEKELGEGRAFLRWLMKHQLSIDWQKKDFSPNPFLNHATAPKHDPNDELAHGHSFAIKPVEVTSRKVKLYVQDNDMLNILALPYGHHEDFLKLVSQYVQQRFEWEKWQVAAPAFIDWLKSQGKRPRFEIGQIGLSLNLTHHHL